MVSRTLFASIAIALLAAASCDPVHDAQISALGPEAPGVSTGPLHRPGQPCTVCHDGAVNDPPAFSSAGTVYASARGTVPVNGATITLTDAAGATFTTTTNEAGNFYVTPYHFLPAYPLKVSVTSGSTTVAMQSHIGQAASCAQCHADPPGPDSPGHVYFSIEGGMVP